MIRKQLLTAVTVLALPLTGHAFTLTSPVLKEGATLQMAQVANVFGCTGKNLSPALAWDNVPAGTKSLAVTVYDPDAPTGSGWWHWVAFNLPPTLKSLPEGAGEAEGKALPKGTVQVRNDYGTPGFGGACPPPGAKPHRYVFTVHALNVDALPLDAGATPAAVGFYLNQHRLGTATLTAKYGR